MKLINAKELFLFDFDGTLVNTSKDVMDAVNYMRKQYKLPDIDIEMTISLIGKGQRYTVEQAIMDGEEINYEEANQHYDNYFTKNLGKRAVFYPHVVETLLELEKKGKTLGIVSNKYSYYIEKILKELNCPVNFDFIYGPDILKVTKPDPEYILKACSSKKIEKSKTVLIGDSVHDIDTGKNAEVTTVYVTYGFSKDKEKLKNTADYNVELFNKILELS